MFDIQRVAFGYRLTLGGFIGGDEMKRWLEESRRELKLAPSSFGALIDMRELKPLPADALGPMHEGQQLYQRSGMRRSAVILSSMVLTLQFRRVARESGIATTERYIDAASDPNWEQTALEWIDHAIEPVDRKVA